MELSNLQPAAGSVHSDNFRRGRGHASGNGKTAGKGHKGQKARSGFTVLKYFKCTQIDCNDILRVSVCEASLRNTSV